MTALSYNKLALGWQPDSQDKRQFYIITAVVFVVMFGLAVAVSVIDVPKKERRVRAPVPERVAKFITEKKKPEAPKPKPKAEPKPKPKPKPKVVRKTETEAEKKKPLTVSEKKARDKAEKSGLLALGGELADLIDTSAVDAMVGRKLKRYSKGAETAAGVNSDVLTANATTGSGGVSSEGYVASVGSTTLSDRDIALVKQSLLKSDEVEREDKSATRERGPNVRSEEEVTIVFDQNKGKLYSIYNRERRKNPSLKGKIVLEITIAPSGKVTAVKMLSSELNDPSLERRLISRVKQFNFGAKEVESVTVTYPIEFLPS